MTRGENPANLRNIRFDRQIGVVAFISAVDI